jgi:hypothetical protein
MSVTGHVFVRLLRAAVNNYSSIIYKSRQLTLATPTFLSSFNNQASSPKRELPANWGSKKRSTLKKKPTLIFMADVEDILAPLRASVKEQVSKVALIN